MAEFRYVYPSETPDGRFVPVVWDKDIPEQAAVSDEDIQNLAEEYSVPAAHIAAVLEVESRGSGFLLKEPAPARPKILFEAHWFYKLTPKPVSRTRPDLSTRHWDRSLYKGGSGEWDRLRDAMEFDPRQALKSASWGLGQVMGFNYPAAGCDSMDQFVVENFSGEKAQLRHMIEFCNTNNLLDEIRKGEWSHFARGYNGKSYRVNRYDTKLARAADHAASRFA